MRNEWITLDDLANILFVSRGSISGDLKDVSRVLDRFGLKLERRSHYGIRVTGPEMARRVCFANIVMSQYGRPSINGHFPEEKVLTGIAECVDEAVHVPISRSTRSPTRTSWCTSRWRSCACARTTTCPWRPSSSPDQADARVPRGMRHRPAGGGEVRGRGARGGSGLHRHPPGRQARSTWATPRRAASSSPMRCGSRSRPCWSASGACTGSTSAAIWSCE